MRQATTLQEAVESILSSDMTIRDGLAAYTGEVRRLSPEMADAYEVVVQRLRAGGAGAGAPEVGDPMPEFLLPNHDGRLTCLADLQNRGPLVVSINRGHWCRFCRIELDALSRAVEDLSRMGAQIVSIMPEREAFTIKVRERGVPFPILSDIGLGYALSLGLMFYIGDELAALMRDRGVSLPDFQGAAGWFLPIPATFVVGRDGIVKARLVDPDFRTERMDVASIVAALQKELASGGHDRD